MSKDYLILLQRLSSFTNMSKKFTHVLYTLYLPSVLYTLYLPMYSIVYIYIYKLETRTSTKISFSWELVNPNLVKRKHKTASLHFHLFSFIEKLTKISS